MSPVPSAEGRKINWINYRTGVKSVQFKMDADSKSASVMLRISTGDREHDLNLYRIFQNLAEELDPNSEWNWEEEITDEYGKTFSQVSHVLKPANIFQKDQWPSMIGFLKQNMLHLDLFWLNNKDFIEIHG